MTGVENTRSERSLCIFCGSRMGRDEKNAETAREIVKLMAKYNWNLIFGGGSSGLMGVVARAAMAQNVRVTGISAQSLSDIEPVLAEVDEMEIPPDIAERKKRMRELATAFLILPGGYGTLDEFFEIMVSNFVGECQKPVIVLNNDGYWNTLKTLLAHIAEEEFASKIDTGLFFDKIEELEKWLAV